MLCLSAFIWAVCQFVCPTVYLSCLHVYLPLSASVYVSVGLCFSLHLILSLRPSLSSRSISFCLSLSMIHLFSISLLRLTLSASSFFLNVNRKADFVTLSDLLSLSEQATEHKRHISRWPGFHYQHGASRMSNFDRQIAPGLACLNFTRWTCYKRHMKMSRGDFCSFEVCVEFDNFIVCRCFVLPSVRASWLHISTFQQIVRYASITFL